MPRRLSLLFLSSLSVLFSRPYAESVLLGVETFINADRVRYILEFDETPEVYYPRVRGKKLQLDLYGVRPAGGAKTALTGPGGEPGTWKSDTAPLAVTSLALPVPRGSRVETVPMATLLFVEIVPEDDERLWALPVTPGTAEETGVLPFAMALYGLDGAEEWVLTLPEDAGQVLFRSEEKGARIEVFCRGLFLDQKILSVGSRFVSQLSQRTLAAAPLSPEGILVFDLRFKKKTKVTRQFLPHNLVVRLEKP